MSLNEFIGVDVVWTHYESPRTIEEASPAVRVIASADYLGDFVRQVRFAGSVQSVRIEPDVLAQLHRQAMRA